MQIQRVLDSEAMLKASGAVIVFFVLVASSFLALPIKPVPLTLQSLAVALSGILLGPRLGPAVVAIWILAGLMGLPVFAMGRGGWHEVLGPTAGYLYSFPLMAYVASRLNSNASTLQTFLAIAVSHLVCLTVGVLWLGLHIGFEAAFYSGFLFFLISSILKSFLGALVLRYLI